MVAFQLSPDMLVHTRFAFSPITEAASALHLLASPPTGSIHLPWIERARENTSDLDLSVLTAMVPPGSLFPDFLYTPALGSEVTLEAQLLELEHHGIEPIAADLIEVWHGRQMPVVLSEVLNRGDLGVRAITDALRVFWDRAVEPFRSSIQAVLEDDVAHRGGQIVTGGIYDLFVDFHPQVCVDGDLLRVHKPHVADADVTCSSSRMTLVPSVFTFPNLVIGRDDSGHVIMVYGARGVGRAWERLDESPAQPPGGTLAALLGRTRATILLNLTVPMTTSELAVNLAQPASTINDHLTCLRAAGLLVSWRRGRKVFYRQTGLAESLVGACQLGQGDLVQ